MFASFDLSAPRAKGDSELRCGRDRAEEVPKRPSLLNKNPLQKYKENSRARAAVSYNPASCLVRLREVDGIRTERERRQRKGWLDLASINNKKIT